MTRHRAGAVVSLALALALASGCTSQGDDSGGSGAVAVDPVEYDLGGATVVLQGFEAGSRFRDMPVRVNGMIAVPEVGEGPFPVVMVLHGNHPGCPTDEGGVDRWPCDPEVEQANYTGFGYLLGALAAQGYVALAPNLNAENTFGFGEPVPGERVKQLTDLHLGALAEAASGGARDFGVEPGGASRPPPGWRSSGTPAVGRLLWCWPATHRSRLAAGATVRSRAPCWSRPRRRSATVDLDRCPGRHAPGWVRRGCHRPDRPVLHEGPGWPRTRPWVASTFLEGASHNAFNTILPPDMVNQSAREDCQSPLDAGPAAAVVGRLRRWVPGPGLRR